MSRLTRLLGIGVLSCTAIVTTALIRQGMFDSGPVSLIETMNENVPETGGADAEMQAGSDSTPLVADISTESKDPPAPNEVGNDNAWPPNIEGLIWEFFAHEGKSNIINFNSVECTPTDCEIEITGTEINPKKILEFGDLYEAMHMEDWNIQQSSIGTREVAPNVRVYSISLSNVPIDQEDFRRAREVATQRDAQD